MKLSASIYSSKTENIIELSDTLGSLGIDFWHIDSIDNLDVFKDIHQLKKRSSIEIDLHIISKRPEEFIKQTTEAGVERVSFQIEELDSEFEFPVIEGTKIGIAIQISNPNLENLILHYQEQVDFVLLMMTTPGISGGKFNKTHFSTIHRLVLKFPSISWCIDGGVNHEVSYILRLIGIDTIVVGSYLTGHENMARAIMDIQSRKVKSDFVVSDYMLTIDELPIIATNSTVDDMLKSIEMGKIGMTFVLDQGSILVGIISNADIRKVLLSHRFDYQMTLDSFINRNPKKIKNTSSTTEMIEFLDTIKFPILVLPLVNEKDELQGAISFHKLLKVD